MTPHDLRQSRLALKMTQKTFAATLGVTANTVARWERGEVPIPTTAALLSERLAEIRRLNEVVARLSFERKHDELLGSVLNENKRLKQQVKQLEYQLSMAGGPGLGLGQAGKSAEAAKIYTP